MMGANYKSKKDLKAAIGSLCVYEETSFLDPEYRYTGKFCVVGPSPNKVVRRSDNAREACEGGLTLNRWDRVKNYGVDLQNFDSTCGGKGDHRPLFTKTALKRAIAEFEAWQRKENGAR